MLINYTTIKIVQFHVLDGILILFIWSLYLPRTWLLDILLTRNIREYLSWLNFRKDIIFYTNIILVCMSTSSPVQVLNNWQTHGQRMRLILYIQLLMCAGGGGRVQSFMKPRRLTLSSTCGKADMQCHCY